MPRNPVQRPVPNVRINLPYFNPPFTPSLSFDNYDTDYDDDYCSCWDGKNLDSPDHKSHVAYPIDGPHAFDGMGVGGQCPESHPVKIPQIMLEVRPASILSSF